MDNPIIELCENYRKQGYACSESVSRAFLDYYHFIVPDEIHKVMSVFAGGAVDDGRCGVLEAGMLILSLLYEKGEFDDHYTAKELAKSLHEEFLNRFDSWNCRDLFYSRYEEHRRKGAPEEDFKCIFHEGIISIERVIQKNIKERKRTKE